MGVVKIDAAWGGYTPNVVRITVREWGLMRL